MDEATLTRTLRSIAADAPLHPAPSADARRRASRLRRSRRTGAAGLAVVVALAVVGTVELLPNGRSHVSAIAPSWVSELSDPDNPNHATTGYVGISRAAGGEWIVYWQGRRLCYQVVGVSGTPDRSECSSPMPTTGAMTLANIGGDSGAQLLAISPAVDHVDVRTVSVPTEVIVNGLKVSAYSGNGAAIFPIAGDGFPARVVVAEGKIVSLRALDKAGKQIGQAVAGPAAPQLRQVLGTFDCSSLGKTGFDLIAPQFADPKSCYGLAPTAMTFVPKSAEALDDSTLGWLVAVTLDDQDRGGFGQLTQRVTTQPAPRNQLAIVFDGKVLSAPTIEQAITGGQFQITGGATPFTEDQARTLAGDLAGG